MQTETVTITSGTQTTYGAITAASCSACDQQDLASALRPDADVEVTKGRTSRARFQGLRCMCCSLRGRDTPATRSVFAEFTIRKAV